MRKITVISALVACVTLGAGSAYALDEVGIAAGKPSVCPHPSSIATFGSAEIQMVQI
ncbi:hypothetical protein HYT05_01580 [Candidatus Kaiserbacteria bacterium]|nr:hypothetical protein [Candidatus Kaiserbacteria bacterium]